MINKEEEGRLERGREGGKGLNKRQSNKMYTQHSLLSHMFAPVHTVQMFAPCGTSV